VEPGGELGWEDAGLFGGDGEGVRHGNGRMGKAPSKGKSGPFGNAQKRLRTVQVGRKLRVDGVVQSG
jgi:hypothetical protein